jgi:hypothetical protein
MTLGAVLILSQAREAIGKEGCSKWCKGTQPKAMGRMCELNTIVSFSFTKRVEQCKSSPILFVEGERSKEGKHISLLDASTGVKVKLSLCFN